MSDMKLFFAVVIFVLLGFNGFSAKVEQLKIMSAFLGKESPVNVILPDSYSTSDSLPVLFLLHGYGGDCGSYLLSYKSLMSNVDYLKIVVVCVNGEGSWYMDSPVKKESRYESYIIKELIPFISKQYKVYQSGNKRGVAGLSMGGFGAVYLGLRNPACFAYVGSTSGGVDIVPFPGHWGLNDLLGDQSEKLSQWQSHSPLYMIDFIDLKKVKFKLVLDCGKDDFFYDANNQFDEKLTQLGFFHEYLVSGGAHTWEYWNKTLPVHLNKFCETVK